MKGRKLQKIKDTETRTPPISDNFSRPGEKSESQTEEYLAREILLKMLSEQKELIEKYVKDSEFRIKESEGRLNEKIDSYDKKSDERQIKAIEALGIFVALFSFISVSIQVFSRISNAWSAGFFVLLIFCSLSIMVILLDLLLIKPPTSLKCFFSEDFRSYLILLFLLVGVGSVFLLRNFQLNPLPGSIEFEDSLRKKVDDSIDEHSYKKSDIDQIMIELKKENTIFKECLKNGGWNKCFN